MFFSKELKEITEGLFDLANFSEVFYQFIGHSSII